MWTTVTTKQNTKSWFVAFLLNMKCQTYFDVWFFDRLCFVSDLISSFIRVDHCNNKTEYKRLVCSFLLNRKTSSLFRHFVFRPKRVFNFVKTVFVFSKLSVNFSIAIGNFFVVIVRELKIVFLSLF